MYSLSNKHFGSYYLYKYITFCICTVLCLLLSVSLSAQPQSKLVYLDENDKLAYTPYTKKGDIIPDFSYCGYMRGEVPIPNVGVVAVIAQPTGGDDSPMIQAVIDSVSMLKLNKFGFRGAILLKKGTYKISSSLKIVASGIVLRGEGNDKDNGTVLLACSPRQYSVIQLGKNVIHKKIQSTENNITDDYVPSGTKTVRVRDAYRKFNVGDNVVLVRPSTSEWIHKLGMDSIPPRPLEGESVHDAFLRFRKQGKKADMNGTKQWVEGSKDLEFERKIVAVSDDEIVLDIPITNALQKEYGGAKIYKYKFSDRIQQCGVENIFGISEYDENVKQTKKHIGEYNSDENHANIFISCQAIENAWVRNVSVEHYDCCVRTSRSTRFFTGQDLSATNPISIITGQRRYAYSLNGQMNLFERCYSSHHRHAFMMGASTAGPNAFVNSRSEMSFASSEPHHRWAAGCLYDNITIKGPEGSLLAVNRNWLGSGQGWAGAQIIFWNCCAPVIMVMQPPTAQNFAIGSTCTSEGVFDKMSREKTIKSINNVADKNYMYRGVPSVGDGWIESADRILRPKSLYYQQLKDRLGAASTF